MSASLCRVGCCCCLAMNGLDMPFFTKIQRHPCSQGTNAVPNNVDIKSTLASWTRVILLARCRPCLRVGGIHLMTFACKLQVATLQRCKVANVNLLVCDAVTARMWRCACGDCLNCTHTVHPLLTLFTLCTLRTLRALRTALFLLTTFTPHPRCTHTALTLHSHRTHVALTPHSPRTRTALTSTHSLHLRAPFSADASKIAPLSNATAFGKPASFYLDWSGSLAAEWGCVAVVAARHPR
jgi:hypothetical protein